MFEAGRKGTRIVPMELAHVAAVARLRHAAFFAGTARTVDEDADDLRKLITGDGFEAAFVAEVDGSVAGSCLFIRHELEPAHDLTPWLAGLVVAPAIRRRGIGAELVRAVEAHAVTRGCDELHLYTDEAEPFYARLGWSVRERFQVDGISSVLMSRRLGDRP
ncbi:GNAT family N-acetyltransferase [Arvimicrobium flavum]|uniref:GNAT family N-acetyltransferase n=1 Tax=Arvimicrobium flavum TaxID=3393320 RepID=UPI00237B6BCE|nr:GNAT family N-acetyltransferase [Mesorhizobium shangrilense]